MQAGRVTPCAPFGEFTSVFGAHGVTRPTQHVAEFLRYGIRQLGFEDENEAFKPQNFAPGLPVTKESSLRGRLTGIMIAIERPAYRHR